jgi:hypothetical protein
MQHAMPSPRVQAQKDQPELLSRDVDAHLAIDLSQDRQNVCRSACV